MPNNHEFSDVVRLAYIGIGALVLDLISIPFLLWWLFHHLSIHWIP